jgi:flagellar biogenesis protein FliO
MSPLSAYLVETFVTLLAVVALAVLILYGARRLGASGSSGPMRLVGRLPLDARRAIFLVKVADRLLVVGSSEAGLSSLGEMPAEKIELPLEPSPATFASILNQFRKNKSSDSSGSDKSDA